MEKVKDRTKPPKRQKIKSIPYPVKVVSYTYSAHPEKGKNNA